jgi:adenylate cyclase
VLASSSTSCSAGFTAQASDTVPDDLVQFLNRVFSDFDRLVERHGLEKI